MKQFEFKKGVTSVLERMNKTFDKATEVASKLFFAHLGILSAAAGIPVLVLMSDWHVAYNPDDGILNEGLKKIENALKASREKKYKKKDDKKKEEKKEDKKEDKDGKSKK